MDKEKLINLISSENISVCENFYDNIAIFNDMLIEKNKVLNLTAITDEDEMILKHYLDSLMGLKYDIIKDGMIVADVGCGAGFPSLVLKFARPKTEFLLIDALKKRLTFIDEVINKTNLDLIDTFHARAEEAGKSQLRETFDVVVSRAVANLNVLLELCIPLLKVGGKFIAYKGAKGKEELENAAQAIKKLNLKVIKCDEFCLGKTDDKRCIIIFEKIKPTSNIYPRQFAKIKKSPL